MTSEIQTKDNLWRKILGEILKGFFCPYRDLSGGGGGGYEGLGRLLETWE